MAAGKKAESGARRRGESRIPADVPNLFRINVEVGNLEQAANFYETLFGLVGRRQAGARCYFTCGAITLQVVDVASAEVGHSRTPHPAAKALYFVVNDLDAVFERARALGCLSPEEVHGEPGGAISVRPWGERSFYAEDPWHNPLCFVESGTIYPG
jgi:predicted enzyme related to lactoylglutathione lyase